MSAVRLQVAPIDRCPVDVTVLLSATVLLLVGLVMVTSASSEVAARSYGHPLFLAGKHTAFLALGLLVLISTLAIPIRVWQRLGIVFYGVSLLLLMVVLIPGLGKTVNGATRWIPLGFFTLQGSEFVKVFSVVFLASYLASPTVRYKEQLRAYLLPLALIGILVGLLLAQPDFGACVVIMTAMLGMLFFAGTPRK